MKVLSDQFLMIRLGNGSRSGNSQKVTKLKVLRIKPPIVENDATSGESILHTFLASQLPYNAKIQILAEIRPKKIRIIRWSLPMEPLKGLPMELFLFSKMWSPVW